MKTSACVARLCTPGGEIDRPRKIALGFIRSPLAEHPGKAVSSGVSPFAPNPKWASVIGDFLPILMPDLNQTKRHWDTRLLSAKGATL